MMISSKFFMVSAFIILFPALARTMEEDISAFDLNGFVQHILDIGLTANDEQTIKDRNLLQYADSFNNTLFHYWAMLHPHGSLAESNDESIFGCETPHKTGQEELFDFLVKNRVDPNSQNAKGCTPLLLAVEHNNPKAAKILLESREIYANADIPDNKRQFTPLYYALSKTNTNNSTNEDIEIITALFDKSQPETIIKTLKKIPQLPFKLKDPRILQISNSAGKTFLHYAVLDPQNTCVKYLVDKGANPLKPDRFGRTPLYIAIEKNNENAAQMLFAACGRPNNLTINGNPFLHHFIEEENVETIKLLLSLGFNPHEKNKMGESAICKALFLKRSKNSDAIKELFKNTPLLPEEKKYLIEHNAAGVGIEINEWCAQEGYLKRLWHRAGNTTCKYFPPLLVKLKETLHSPWTYAIACLFINKTLSFLAENAKTSYLRSLKDQIDFGYFKFIYDFCSTTFSANDCRTDLIQKGIRQACADDSPFKESLLAYIRTTGHDNIKKLHDEPLEQYLDFKYKLPIGIACGEFILSLIECYILSLYQQR